MKYIFTLLVLLTASVTHAQTDTIRIFFDFDSYSISEPEISKLNTDSKLIGIAAFCDTMGSTRYNLKLAERRMNVVLDYINETNTPQINRLIAGEVQPQGENYDPDFSRRVELYYESGIEEEVVEPEDIVRSETEAIIRQFEQFIADSSVLEAKIDLTIQFYPGMDVVLPQYEEQLWVLFDFMNYHTNMHAEIHGHVCCADDYPLSYRRAKLVYDFLSKRGVSVKRITYEGFSNKKPKISPEVTEMDRQHNRRVEVIFRKNGYQ